MPVHGLQGKMDHRSGFGLSIQHGRAQQNRFAFEGIAFIDRLPEKFAIAHAVGISIQDTVKLTILERPAIATRKELYT